MTRRVFLYGGGAAVAAAAGAVGVLAGRSAGEAPVTIDAIGDRVHA